ncbi:MAG: hypothetical protein ACKV2V_22295 [Blastocatellia bacterium]
MNDTPDNTNNGATAKTDGADGMDAETKTRLKAILLRRKLSRYITEEETAFARKCWLEWPKEYSALQANEVNAEATEQFRTRPSQHFNPGAPRNAGPGPTPRTPPRRGRR